MKRRDALVALGSIAMGGLASGESAAETTEKTPSATGHPKGRTLLRIDSSSRVKGSHSRQLADVIEKSWKEKYPTGRVVVRDFARQPSHHVEHQAIDGFYSEPAQYSAATKRAMAYSDTLIRELLAADDLLFSIPIYNFTVPSALKAWIDQIVRPGYAFEYTADGQVKGLLTKQRAYMALAYGFEYTGTDMAAYDALRPYLQSIFGYVGLSDIKYVAVEGTALGDAAKLEKNTQKAHAAARQLVT